MAHDEPSHGFAEEPALEVSDDPYACSPEHDRFIRREVAKTLERKRRGETDYVSLDQAMKKLLPDAR